MPLFKEWGRGLVGASSAALLAPATIIAALCLLALGGLHGLGTLGEAFSGPRLPAPPPTSAGRSAAGALVAPAAIPAPALAAPARAGAAATRASALPGTGGVSSRPPGTAGGGRRGGGPTHGPAPTAPVAPVTPVKPAPPAPKPGPVDLLVGAGTSITGGIPGPVGTIGTAAVQAVGATVKRIVPPLQVSSALRFP
jgi:hypothetical protein